MEVYTDFFIFTLGLVNAFHDNILNFESRLTLEQLVPVMPLASTSRLKVVIIDIIRDGRINLANPFGRCQLLRLARLRVQDELGEELPTVDVA